MSKISQMRNSALSAQAKKERVERAVMKVLEEDSSAANLLTLANHASSGTSQKEINKLMDEVSKSVANAVVDPVPEFLDVCKYKGLKQSEIIRSVRVLNTVFGCTSENATQDEKLQAVAKYLQANQHLYDEIGVLG